MNVNPNRRTVCHRCAKIKQACDGGSPCARCKRLDVSCEPNDPAKHSSNSSIPISKPSRIIRTHTGCSSCKKRRRKCDEARPRCSDCRRLCLDCRYSTPVPASTSSSSPSDQSPSTTTPTSVTHVSQPQLPPLDHSILGYPQDSMTASVSPNDWTDITDLWSTTSQSHLDLHLAHARATPISSPSLPLVMMSTVPDLSAAEDKSLLNHYMKVVAGVLSRRDDKQSNPYLTKILPMAFQNQLVMDAVLALSASHWRKMQPSIFRRGTIHQTSGMTPQRPARSLPS